MALGPELWSGGGVGPRNLTLGGAGVSLGCHLSDHFLIAGGLGLSNISAFAKKLSIIFFALFFLGFLALLGFAYLGAGAVSSSQLLPAMVAVSV